jgi:hypothetical protein
MAKFSIPIPLNSDDLTTLSSLCQTLQKFDEDTAVDSELVFKILVYDYHDGTELGQISLNDGGIYSFYPSGV